MLERDASRLPALPTLERETGIEPATNSLEGCDSTTELLPPVGPATAPAAPATPFREPPTLHTYINARRSDTRLPRGERDQAGGEGRIRTSEAAGAADLQSAAFDRSATSPARLSAGVRRLARNATGRRRRGARRRPHRNPEHGAVPLASHWCRAACCVHRMSAGMTRSWWLTLRPDIPPMELAEGFEPPTG